MKKYIQILSLAIIATLLMSSCGKKDTLVMIETNQGNMKVKLYDSTPKHQANFVKLANEGFYDGLLFHRVIRNFMIQGGDPNSKGAQPDARLGGGGPGYQIDAEIGAPHVKGALAAARNNNPDKKSSGSQFYIVQGTPVNEAMLKQHSQRSKMEYTPEQIATYVEKGGYPGLDGAYTVFGELVEGFEVLDKIASVKTAPGDRPEEDVIMTKVYVTK